ncbi:hypothetical protein SKAU_G00195030 [Synaphobranchus kaupii]|uniref:SWIM-type domain-containing protein n=1 Tax=Synaphobranchus kaupii TaxID=118154 RepID=A0A9Q1IWR3_SYNKA|nr:hypothetical protein SKAU_G00195030 [Synaphobranchus kaupii]
MPPVVLQHSQCTCVAGRAVCNHADALLYQTAHYCQYNLQMVPPVLSCTESEQRWHKPRTMGVKPGPVKKMVVVFAKPKQRTIADGVSYRLEPSNCQFVCSLQQQFHLKSLEMPWEMAREFEATTHEQSSSTEWHNIRKPRIMLSRFRKVCHVCSKD